MSGCGGRGRLVAFEGGEATGKSTQAARLAARLGAVLTHEPGGTKVGRALRSIVLSRETVGLGPRTEALLLAADRAQHVAEIVEPALRAGRHVVTDRFSGSSVAYQGHGRGLPVAEVQRLSRWATDGLSPDVVVVLEVPVEVSLARLGPDRDRMETEDASFHARVLDGFLSQAAADPARWAVVDGTGSPDATEAAVWAEVVRRLPDLAAAIEPGSAPRR